MIPAVSRALGAPLAAPPDVVGQVQGRVLAAGIWNRDLVTFVEACRELDQDAVILTDLARLSETIPANEQGARLRAALDRAPRVRVLGPVSLDVYVECLRAARVVVVPLFDARFTAGHLTIADALCLGRPVVAADLPTARDFIEPGESGLLYDAGRPDSLARQLGTLLGDPALRERVGQGGRAAEQRISAAARDTFLQAQRRVAAGR